MRGGDASATEAAKGQFAAAAEALYAAFREARLRAAPQVAVRTLEAPCLPAEQPTAAVTAAEGYAHAQAATRAVAATTPLEFAHARLGSAPMLVTAKATRAPH